jgi:hypothetical protein
MQVASKHYGSESLSGVQFGSSVFSEFQAVEMYVLWTAYFLHIH